MNKKLALLLMVVLLSGCGGPGRATPTPIPASVARPKQPTPIYPDNARVFSLATPLAPAQFAPTSAPELNSGADAAANVQRDAIKLFIQNQTPSAVGIATGGASIFSAPGGRAVASVPAGGVVTVTGKSADGQWYSVYSNDFAFGWAPAGQVRVFGGEDLVVVDRALDPAPVATLLAQSAQPVRVLDALMATLQATPVASGGATAVPTAPAVAQATAEPITPVVAQATAPAVRNGLATPTPQATAINTLTATPVATIASTNPLAARAVQTGTVVSDGRLNVRAEPATNGAIVVKLDPGTQVTITDRSPAGDWLRVQLEDGATGWVAAEFIR